MEKEMIYMILFIILTFILLILGVITITAISIGGSAFILIFGDVIVCMALIVLIMKFIKNRR